MSDSHSVTDLLHKAQAGDVEARAALRTRMKSLVIGVARCRLSDDARHNIGTEEDVEASVGAEFFGRMDKLTFLDPTDRSHLEATLAQAARQKAIDYWRRVQVRVKPLREADLQATKFEEHRVFDPQDTRAEEAISYQLAEKLEGSSSQHLRVAELLCEGYSEREIADELKLTRYRVSLLVKEIATTLGFTNE